MKPTAAPDAVAGPAEPDLLALTAELVDIPSVSHDEKAVADRVEEMLSGTGHLEVLRLADNVLARTHLGRPMRLLLAGHLDTVPPNGNERAVIEGDTLRGLGAADMKGGLAVMAEVVRCIPAPAVDVTFIAYVCEEVDQVHSGLGAIAAEAPEWLDGNAAVLGEPTSSIVEAGCQGMLRVAVDLQGERAHTARPWMGVNAIHRLGPLLEAVSSFTARRPVIDGCEYREALQAVEVDGGVAYNVVPDAARLVVNHRFAPDVTAAEAFASVSAVVEPFLDRGRGDRLTLEAASDGARPGLAHPLLARLVESSAARPRAKLGWTDVSFFAARGVPAANFGPGEPSLAHSPGEMVERADLERAYATLRDLLLSGVA